MILLNFPQSHSKKMVGLLLLLTLLIMTLQLRGQQCTYNKLGTVRPYQKANLIELMYFIYCGVLDGNGFQNHYRNSWFTNAYINPNNQNRFRAMNIYKKGQSLFTGALNQRVYINIDVNISEGA